MCVTSGSAMTFWSIGPPSPPVQGKGRAEREGRTFENYGEDRTCGVSVVWKATLRGVCFFASLNSIGLDIERESMSLFRTPALPVMGGSLHWQTLAQMARWDGDDVFAKYK